MESKDYFNAVSVATNNVEKKKTTVYDSVGKTANNLYEFGHRTI